MANKAAVEKLKEFLESTPPNISVCIPGLLGFPDRISTHHQPLLLVSMYYLFLLLVVWGEKAKIRGGQVG